MKKKDQSFFTSKKIKREFELLGGVSATAASLLVISIFLLTSLDKILIQSNQYAAVVTAVLTDLLNTDRASNQIEGLTVNPTLVVIAQAKADDMAAKGYFAHTSPDGHDPWYWFKQVGYKFTYAGENLAVDFSDSVDVERAWMNSPTHRKNLLDPHFTEVGIATASGFYQGRPTVFVVQEFGAPAKSGVTAALEITTPKDPTALARAVPKLAPKVLGEQVSQGDVTPVKAPPPTINVRPLTASEVVQAPQQASSIEHFFASPKDVVYLAYYIIAALILISLAIDTGLQIRLHHERKALTAGLMLALVLIFVIMTNIYLFPHPVLADDVAVNTVVAAAR